MLKMFLISASALALSAGVAAAQTPPAFANAVSVQQLNLQTRSGGGLQANTISGRPSDATSVPDNGGTRYQIQEALVQSAEDIMGLVDADPGVSADNKRGNAGTSNKATAMQDGANNTGNINQEGGDEGYAVLNQRGDWNDADIDQVEAAGGNGDLSAAASANEAYVQQHSAAGELSSNGSSAKVFQNYDEGVGTFGTSTANRAVIMQGDADFPASLTVNNDAEIYQAGTTNEALVRQSFFGRTVGGEGIVSQVGFANNGTIRQGDGFSNAFENTSPTGLIRQEGDFGEAHIVQGGMGNTMATISQIDNSQYASAYVVQFGENASASVLQGSAGFGAEAYVEQTELANNSIVEVEQDGGTDLYVDIFQNATAAKALSYQTGVSNVALITQGTASASAYASQAGSFNNLTINQ